MSWRGVVNQLVSEASANLPVSLTAPSRPDLPTTPNRGHSLWISILHLQPPKLSPQTTLQPAPSPPPPSSRPHHRDPCKKQKNFLFLGCRIQGDVGQTGDPGRPLANGGVELVGFPKGDKGAQVCGMMLFREIKRDVSWARKSQVVQQSWLLL